MNFRGDKNKLDSSENLVKNGSFVNPRQLKSVSSYEQLQISIVYTVDV